MRFKHFVKTIPMKLWAILAAIVVFSFFSNDFGLVDIQKTAIILAAGIDKTEQGFSVTAQIAVPKGSDRTTGGTSSVEIDAEGETVSDCVSLIFAKTGWVPKLVFCNLIVLGEEAAGEDVISHLNYFLRNDYMPDSCFMAVCEGKAGDLISSKSAIDDASSLAIGKLFSDAAEKSGRVMPNTLKDFAIGYYGVSKSGYLPFIRMTDQEGEQNDSQSTAGGGSQSSGGGGESEPQKIYSAEETAIFNEGKMVGLLPPEQTFAFSLLKGNVFTGTFNAEDNGTPVTLTVVKNEGKASLETKPSPTAKLSVNVTARLCCRSVAAEIADVAADTVNDATLQSANETLNGYVETLWQMLREAKCDLFCFKRSLYRKSLKKYAAQKDTFWDEIVPQIETKVISMK